MEQVRVQHLLLLGVTGKHTRNLSSTRFLSCWLGCLGENKFTKASEQTLDRQQQKLTLYANIPILFKDLAQCQCTSIDQHSRTPFTECAVVEWILLCQTLPLNLATLLGHQFHSPYLERMMTSWWSYLTVLSMVFFTFIQSIFGGMLLVVPFCH